MSLAGFDGWTFIATIRDASLLAGLEIAAQEGHDRELTARLLRSVPVGELATVSTGTVRRWLADSLEQRNWFGPSAYPEWDSSLGNTAERISERVGRRGKRDDDFLDLAVRYAQLIDAGEKAPLRTLAREFHLAESTVRNALHACRHRRGLLTAPPPGRSGGSLTEKAQALLANREDRHGKR